MPLHDEEIPDEGMDLEEFIGDPFADLEAIFRELKKAAHEQGLVLNNPGMICRTGPAHEIRAWAEMEHECGRELERALFQAYFVRGINLGDRYELLQIAREFNLPEKDCRSVQESGKYREKVQEDIQKARELEITCAPTFVRGKKKLAGFKPYPELKNFILSS
jgi:predicted DsbA family dithiol-disulfide isomerase